MRDPGQAVPTPHPTQLWDPKRYQTNAGFVAKLGAALIELLEAKPGWRVLDLGCGDGALTIMLSQMGLEVHGVDSSTEQIDAAKARGLSAQVLDGQKLDFAAEFDAVLSNAALHWMKDDPAAVLRGVWNALKPGGVFVAECGGAGNVETIWSALTRAMEVRGYDAKAAYPWYFPRPDAYRSLLEEQGFTVEFVEHFARPTPLPGDISAWLDTFCQSFLGSVLAAERAEIVDEPREALRPKLCDDDGNWTADYVRLRFKAQKPHA